MKRIGVAFCSVVVVLILGLAVTAQVIPQAESVPVAPPPPGVAFQGVGQPMAVPVNDPVRHGKDGIEVLMDKLATIKAQKAELDKVEKQTVALLREKLKHQKERLQKLGVEPPESPPSSVPATPVTASEPPKIEKPW